MDVFHKKLYNDDKYLNLYTKTPLHKMCPPLKPVSVGDPETFRAVSEQRSVASFLKEKFM